MRTGLEFMKTEHYRTLPSKRCVALFMKETKKNLLNGVELLQTELGGAPRIRGGEKKAKRYELVKIVSGFYEDGYRPGRIVARVRSADVL